MILSPYAKNGLVGSLEACKKRFWWLSEEVKLDCKPKDPVVVPLLLLVLAVLWPPEVDVRPPILTVELLSPVEVQTPCKGDADLFSTPFPVGWVSGTLDWSGFFSASAEVADLKRLGGSLFSDTAVK